MSQHLRPGGKEGMTGRRQREQGRADDRAGESVYKCACTVASAQAGCEARGQLMHDIEVEGRWPEDMESWNQAAIRVLLGGTPVPIDG